jgi:hypothetical protein
MRLRASRPSAPSAAPRPERLRAALAGLTEAQLDAIAELVAVLIDAEVTRIRRIRNTTPTTTVPAITNAPPAGGGVRGPAPTGQP